MFLLLSLLNFSRKTLWPAWLCIPFLLFLVSQAFSALLPLVSCFVQWLGFQALFIPLFIILADLILLYSEFTLTLLLVNLQLSDSILGHIQDVLSSKKHDYFHVPILKAHISRICWTPRIRSSGIILQELDSSRIFCNSFQNVLGKQPQPNFIELQTYLERYLWLLPKLLLVFLWQTLSNQPFQQQLRSLVRR